VAALIVGIGIGSVTSSGDTTATATGPDADLVEQIEKLESENELLQAELEYAEALADAWETATEEDEQVTDDDDGLFRATVGETVTITEDGTDAYLLTITEVETLTQPVRTYGDPPKHGQFAVFHIEVEGLASSTFSGDDFYIRTADGTRYDEGDGNAWDAVGDSDDRISYVSFNAGERRTGVIVFDIPNDDTAELAFAPNYRSGPIGVWDFAD
jgi:hypothetical protein